MPRNSSSELNSVVQKLIAILGAFDEEKHALNLSQIAERAQLPVSTAYRLVRELVAGGILMKGSDKNYRVGTRLWMIAQAAPVNDQLRESALPTLARLYEETGENVTLAVLDRNRALYVDRIFGAQSVPTISKAGGHLPLHTTGVGKVLLAYQPAEKIEAYLAKPLAKPTKYSKIDPESLRKELEETRARGYSITREEMSIGSSSMAMPIWVNGNVVAAVGVVVHADRLDIPRLTGILEKAAISISRGLSR